MKAQGVCGLGPDNLFDLSYNLNLGGGFVPIEKAAQALGLILLSRAKVKTPIVIRVIDEKRMVEEYEYDGMRWRFTIVTIFDVRREAIVPFRIDLDYLGQATQS